MATISERLRFYADDRDWPVPDELVREAADTIDALVAALERITKVEFSGSCCGCSHDDGFDEVQKIAKDSLARAKG